VKYAEVLDIIESTFSGTIFESLVARPDLWIAGRSKGYLSSLFS
jgi:hypothetical protein